MTIPLLHGLRTHHDNVPPYYYDQVMGAFQQLTLYPPISSYHVHGVAEHVEDEEDDPNWEENEEEASNSEEEEFDVINEDDKDDEDVEYEEKHDDEAEEYHNESKEDGDGENEEEDGMDDS